MPLTAKQALARVNALYAELRSRRTEIDQLEDAFEGKQPLAYASEQWQKFHQDRFRNFADNWCGVVGRAAPERTELFGIRLGDDADVQSEDEKQLWTDWVVNDGDAQSAQGFLTSAVAKRSFALVWGDSNDEPVLSWEHPSQAIVGYEPGGRTQVAALKAWLDGEVEYATLYTADEVWKFQRPKSWQTRAQEAGIVLPASVMDAEGWEPREVAGEPWPLEHDLGVVPMVEFQNRPLLGKGPLSDIAGTLAMQDAINLMWAYLFTAADHASMPARVVLGAEPPKMPVLDEKGQVVGERPLDIDALTKGRMLWLTGQNAKIGQWDAARLDVFTGVLNVMVKHVASQTRTPIHYIMGELGNVNGETLTATELPLAMKVREGHKHSTSPARGVFRRFALVRGKRDIAEACRTAVVQWRNPETSSDAQTSDAALKDKGVGWPFAAILERRYGLSQPEIARVMAQVEAEANDPLVQQIMRDTQQLSGGQGAA